MGIRGVCSTKRGPEKKKKKDEAPLNRACQSKKHPHSLKEGAATATSRSIHQNAAIYYHLR